MSMSAHRLYHNEGHGLQFYLSRMHAKAYVQVWKLNVFRETFYELDRAYC